MRTPEAPCKGCEERQVGCHASCGKYAEFRKKRDEYNEIVVEEKYPTGFTYWVFGGKDRGKR